MPLRNETAALNGQLYLVAAQTEPPGFRRGRHVASGRKENLNIPLRAHKSVIHSLPSSTFRKLIVSSGQRMSSGHAGWLLLQLLFEPLTLLSLSLSRSGRKKKMCARRKVGEVEVASVSANAVSRQRRMGLHCRARLTVCVSKRKIRPKSRH
jgi:hypothetical protein